MTNLNPVTNISNYVDVLFDISVDDDQTEVINLGGRVLTGIYMPAAWTAAALTFLASYDGTNFFPIYDDTGTEVSVTAAASTFITINPSTWFGTLHYLKIRSGTAGTPVAQLADRTLTLILGDPGGR